MDVHQYKAMRPILGIIRTIRRVQAIHRELLVFGIAYKRC